MRSHPAHYFRFVIRITVVILCCLPLMFCNRKNQPDTSGTPTLQFWHFRSEPKHREAIQKLITRFEQENKCKISITLLNWGDGKTKLLAAFNSNTAPDVLELGSDWIAQFSAGGVLQNLSASGFTLHNYVNFASPPAMYGNKIYALPWIVDTRVMFYSKNLMKRAGVKSVPQTFDELFIACEKIRSLGDDVYGFGVNGSDEHRLYKKILSFFWSSGGDILDVSGKPVINSAANVKALESYITLARCGFVETQRQLDNMFIQGKIGFIVSGSWMLDKIKQENANLQYGAALVPALAGHNAISFAGANYLAINSRTEKSELAKKFISFMTNGENALEFCKQFSEAGFPADKKYVNAPYFATVPHRKIFAEQLLMSKMPPVHSQWLDMEKIIEEATVEALFGKKTARQALDDAQWQIAGIVGKRPM